MVSGETGGLRGAGYISVAGGVHCNTGAEINRAAAQESGKDKDGVDDQGLREIIVTDGNPDLVSLLQHKTCFYQSLAIPYLVSHGLLETNFAANAVQFEIPIFPIDPNLPPPWKTQPDTPRIRIRGHHKVKLQPPPVAIV